MKHLTVFHKEEVITYCQLSNKPVGLQFGMEFKTLFGIPCQSAWVIILALLFFSFHFFFFYDLYITD